MYTSWSFIFAVIFCFIAVNARHHAERQSDAEELTSIHEQEHTDKNIRTRDHSQMRHRRKRWQGNLGYNYPVPQQPFYENDRRDYYQADMLSQIYRLLDEISAELRRPPPPPTPIYIPYPVHYPVARPCFCNNRVRNRTGIPDLPSRFPDMDDTNQNWGFASEDESDFGDYRRPLSFSPLRPSFVGSAVFSDNQNNQDGLFTTAAPNPQAARAPNPCDAAVLSCCRPMDSKQQRKRCFNNLRCASRFSENVCSRESIDSVIDIFTKTYSPV